jgi:hypothetical protein
MTGEGEVMATTDETIELDETTPVGPLLERAEAGPILLRRNGHVYRLESQPAYDPEKAIAGMRAAAGSWSDVDADEMKAYIRRGRDEGTRPIDRPRPLDLPRGHLSARSPLTDDSVARCTTLHVKGVARPSGG